MEEDRSAFKILVGKPTGKRSLERPRRWWEDNIRIDLKEIGINTKKLSWFGSRYELLESPCECGHGHSDSISQSVSSNFNINNYEVEAT